MSPVSFRDPVAADLRLTSRVSRLFFALCVCFVAAEIWLTIASHEPRLSQWSALAALIVAGLGCTLYLALRTEETAPGTYFVLGFAATTRLIPLFAQPLFDDDYFRFLWDGYQLIHGESPYSSSPAANFARTDLSEPWHDVLAQINHPEVPTIYGPFLQAIFALAVSLGGAQPVGLQAVFCGVDLMLIGVLLRFGIAPQWVMMYVVNPLVIKEICFSLHPDGVIAAALSFAVLSLARQRVVMSGLWTAAVVCAKPPLGLLVFALNARNTLHREALLFAVVIAIALYLPFMLGGTDPFVGLKTFAQDWRFNALGFSVFEWTAGAQARAVLAVCYVLAGLGLAVVVSRYQVDTATALALWLAVIVTLSPAVNPWYWLPLLPLTVIARQTRGKGLVTPWVGSFALLLAYANGALLSEIGVPSTLAPFEVHPAARVIESVLIASALGYDFLGVWRDRDGCVLKVKTTMQARMQLLLFIVALIPPALLRWLLRWHFKTVQQQAPMSLARCLTTVPVLLLDVRTHDEFESGHLAGAIHVNDTGSAQRLIHDFRLNTPNGQIVAYCTVGYRSAQLAERLTSLGCVNVKNLQGGVWAWIAAGQPVKTRQNASCRLR